MWLPASWQVLGTAKNNNSKKKVLSIFALFDFVCGFEAMGLQSVAAQHISVSSVIYVHEGLYNGASVWKLEAWP